MNLRSWITCLFAAAFSVSIANADTITVSVTPVSGNGALTLTFDPATDAYNSQDGIGTSFNATGTDSLGDFSTLVGFYNTAFTSITFPNPWDFVYDDRSQTSYLYAGLIMYSGPEASPTILPGTYDVSAVQAPSDATVQISVEPSVAVTPEPSSLLLLATGLVGMGLMLRRRLTL